MATDENTAGQPRRAGWRVHLQRLIQAISDSDLAAVEAATLRISRSRRWLAPLALAVGAFAMLFEGVKLLLTNWRLTLITVLPAMWIWLAMFDLKAHVLHGKSFHVLRGPVLILAAAAIVAITAACFFLNAVFAFAIAQPGRPAIRPAFRQTRSHLPLVLGSGAVVGLALALSTVLVVRWGYAWFGLSLSIVLAVMMFCYVTVPARLIGMRSTHSKRDSLTASAVGGAIGAMVCTPPYLLARLGVLMLGSHALFIPGIIILTIGIMVQAGATGAVKAIKMTASLVSGHQPGGSQAAAGTSPHPDG